MLKLVKLYLNGNQVLLLNHHCVTLHNFLLVFCKFHNNTLSGCGISITFTYTTISDLEILEQQLENDGVTPPTLVGQEVFSWTMTWSTWMRLKTALTIALSIDSSNIILPVSISFLLENALTWFIIIVYFRHLQPIWANVNIFWISVCLNIYTYDTCQLFRLLWKFSGFYYCYYMGKREFSSLIYGVHCLRR